MIHQYSEFPLLETPRLRLRALQLTDSFNVFEILSSDRITRHYGIYPFKTLGDAVHMIEGYQRSFCEGRSIRWAIEEAETGLYIGSCGFQNMHRLFRRAEIGYELAESAWHKGYCQEALHRMMVYGFEVLNLHRIEALVYPENRASQRVLEKLGFEQEGLLKGYAYFRDVYQDLLLYGYINQNHSRSDLNEN